MELLSEETEDRLWQEFRVSDDNVEDKRWALVEYYLPTVHKIAAREYAKRIDNVVEFNDYMHTAVVGLIESIDRYDYERGVPFMAYASHRIQGAISNEVGKWSERREQLAWRRRVQKDRVRSLSETDASRPDNDAFEELVDVAIGLALGYMLQDSGMLHDDALTQSMDAVYESDLVANVRRQLEQIIEELPSKERTIIRYHYFNQINFTDIADLLGLTKGRVSQLHKRALDLLRQKFEDKQTLNDYF